MEEKELIKIELKKLEELVNAISLEKQRIERIVRNMRREIIRKEIEWR